MLIQAYTMQNHHSSYTKSNFATVICDQVCMCVCVQKACPAHLWQFQLSRPIVTIYEEDLPAKSNWSSSVALTSCMCQHKIRRFAGLSPCHAGHELRIEKYRVPCSCFWKWHEANLPEEAPTLVGSQNHKVVLKETSCSCEDCCNSWLDDAFFAFLCGSCLWNTCLGIFATQTPWILRQIPKNLG